MPNYEEMLKELSAKLDGVRLDVVRAANSRKVQTSLWIFLGVMMAVLIAVIFIRTQPASTESNALARERIRIRDSIDAVRQVRTDSILNEMDRLKEVNATLKEKEKQYINAIAANRQRHNAEIRRYENALNSVRGIDDEDSLRRTALGQ